MKRLVLALLMGLLWQAPALGETISEQVVANLREQGYTVRQMQHTWLGRIWLLADNGKVQREVVFNPGTGEILRDYAVLIASLPTPTKHDGETLQAGGADGSSVTATATVAADAGMSLLGGPGVEGPFGAVGAGVPSEVVVEPINPLP